jgi:hypothetical protein
MVVTDGIILADATNGNITFTLLPFSQVPNQEMRVQKIDGSANTVTIACTSPDELAVNGVLSSTDVLTAQWQFDLITIPGE